MKTNLFISGSFSDVLNHMEVIQRGLEDAGFTVRLKRNDSDPPSQELIDDAEIFIAVVGLEEGAIKTPTGETLPQAELNYAIRRRKPVIAFLYKPGEKSRSPSQERLRQLVRLRLGQTVVTYEDAAELLPACIQLMTEGVEALAVPLKPNKAFVCHSSKDKPIVERIVQRLKQAEILTFYDKHDIGVGMSLTDTIRTAIAEVGYVVVCLSPSAIESQWVRDEIAWALEQANHLSIDGSDFVLPVRIKPFELPEELRFLGDRKYADVAADFESGVSTLTAALMG